MNTPDLAKAKMQAAADHYKTELKNMRSNRDNPGMLDGVHVEVYGSSMRLKEVANITTPESRQLLITPFDGSNTQACAKAIDKANLGVTAVVDGKSVRVIFPELDQNRRKALIEQCHKKREDSKIAIRNVRRDQNEVAKKQKSAGTLPEDAFKKLEKLIQEMTDKACKEADDACQVKEKEISTV